MICAYCHDASTEPPVCRACGQDPRLEGRYLLLKVIGQGANATLYQAADGERGAFVAIKERHPQGPLDATADRLFEREVAVLRQLDHPQIPAYVDAFASGRGRARRHYLVQELVRGRSLDQIAERSRFTERFIRSILRDVAEILVYLHGLAPPVVHRDLKPGNVMRRDDGTIVLVDFGAVRDALPGTLGGQTVAGTFGYMAPEQFMGDGGPPADIYGLAAMAIALLSRRDPATLLDRRRQFHWERAVATSDPLRALLRTMLAEDPAARPTARQVIAALDAIPADAPLAPAPQAPAPKPRASASPTPPSASSDISDPSAFPASSNPSASTLPSASTRPSTPPPLAALAERGRSLTQRRQSRAAQALARQTSTEARQRDEARDKRRREALLPPWFGAIVRHQSPLGFAFTMISAFVGLAAIIAIMMVLGPVISERVQQRWEFLIAIGMLLACGATLIASFIGALTLFEALLRMSCRAFAAAEERRLRALPLPLDVDPYLDGLHESHLERAVIRIESGRELPRAVVDALRDGLVGAGLDGTVRADRGAIELISPKMRLATFHGRNFSHKISHYSLLHAWVRRVLDRLILPARDDLAPVRVALRVEQ